MARMPRCSGMRTRFALSAAVLVFAQTIASAGDAQGGSSGVDLVGGAPGGIQACAVVALDSVTLNFICRTNDGMRQYWIARSTQFIGGGSDASFFELTNGQPVQVTFHNAGRLAIADSIRF